MSELETLNGKRDRKKAATAGVLRRGQGRLERVTGTLKHQRRVRTTVQAQFKGWFGNEGETPCGQGHRQLPGGSRELGGGRCGNGT